jgi:hypothetical protein
LEAWYSPSAVMIRARRSLIQLLRVGPVPGGEQGDDLADGRLPGARRGYRQVSLDLVAVAAGKLLHLFLEKNC